MFPCPSSRQITWSRDIGSAVLSLVSLLILHTRAESGAYSWDSSRFSAVASMVYLYREPHWVSQEFIRPRKYVPLAFTAECPPAQGQQ